MAAIPPIPADIQSLCEELNGKQLVHITEKKTKEITRSDLDEQQSRLRLPKSSESAIQQDLLSLEQQAKANILSRMEMERKIEINFLTQEDMRNAMELKGVDVWVFIFLPGEPRRQGRGVLTKWNCGSTVIHGRDAMRALRHIKKGDLVKLWVFKDEENKLYIAIYKL